MSLKLKFPADPAELSEMRQKVRDFLLHCGVVEMDAELMVLALDEACTNVIRYAYGGCSRRTIRLAIDRLHNAIRCVLRDYGVSCDPEKIRGRDLADFRPGGLGVRIMHCAFDQVSYEPRPRGTRLTLVKNLNAAKAAQG